MFNYNYLIIQDIQVGLNLQSLFKKCLTGTVFNQKGKHLSNTTFYLYSHSCLSIVAALDISLGDNFNSCPVCSYMSEEVY